MRAGECASLATAANRDVQMQDGSSPLWSFRANYANRDWASAHIPKASCGCRGQHSRNSRTRKAYCLPAYRAKPAHACLAIYRSLALQLFDFSWLSSSARTPAVHRHNVPDVPSPVTLSAAEGSSRACSEPSLLFRVCPRSERAPACKTLDHVLVSCTDSFDRPLQAARWYNGRDFDSDTSASAAWGGLDGGRGEGRAARAGTLSILRRSWGTSTKKMLSATSLPALPRRVLGCASMRLVLLAGRARPPAPWTPVQNPPGCRFLRTTRSRPRASCRVLCSGVPSDVSLNSAASVDLVVDATGEDAHAHAPGQWAAQYLVRSRWATRAACASALRLAGLTGGRVPRTVHRVCRTLCKAR